MQMRLRELLTWLAQQWAKSPWIFSLEGIIDLVGSAVGQVPLGKFKNGNADAVYGIIDLVGSAMD